MRSQPREGWLGSHQGLEWGVGKWEGCLGERKGCIGSRKGVWGMGRVTWEEGEMNGVNGLGEVKGWRG